MHPRCTVIWSHWEKRKAPAHELKRRKRLQRSENQSRRYRGKKPCTEERGNAHKSHASRDTKSGQLGLDFAIAIPLRTWKIGTFLGRNPFTNMFSLWLPTFVDVVAIWKVSEGLNPTAFDFHANLHFNLSLLFTPHESCKSQLVRGKFEVVSSLAPK